MANRTGDTFLALLIGAAIGVGVGILFAPDKGEKTREKLKDGFDDLKDQAKDKWSSIEEEAKDKFSKSFKIRLKCVLLDPIKWIAQKYKTSF